MEASSALAGLVALLGLGLAAQVVAARMRIPSIVLLVIVGFVVGPMLDLIDPEAMFGNAVVPFVSLAVAIILFDGGLDLEFAKVRSSAAVLPRLVIAGMAITLAATVVAAHWLLGCALGTSVLLGAILVVAVLVATVAAGLASGTILGLVGGFAVRKALDRFWISDRLEYFFVLTVVLLLFTLQNRSFQNPGS